MPYLEGRNASFVGVIYDLKDLYVGVLRKVVLVN